MFGIFESNSESSFQAKTLAASAPIIGEKEILENVDTIEKIFMDRGVSFDKNRFIKVSCSMFCMLVIDNIKRRDYYEEKEEAIESFISQIHEKYLHYVNLDSTFKGDIDERDALRNEAAVWAGKKYLGRKPTVEEAALFRERSTTFVNYIEHSDNEGFNL
mgnify:CR=1 FL=1